MSEPQNKMRPPRPPPRPVRPRASAPAASARADTGPRLTELGAHEVEELPADSGESQHPSNDATPAGGTRLKIVTVAPGRGSFADPEMPSAQRIRARNDPYMGATIDGRYKVEAVLGEGGMGVVYRCSHTIIGKKVAMKVLRPDLARDVEVTERFLNEAKAASAVGNPHIIDISDFGQFADGATYFVMEYLSGKPLSKAMEGGNPMSLTRLIHIARQLAEGLAAAHEAGIVHRDLKPDNIYLVDRGGEKDFVKILDFGIAKVSTTGEGRLTRAGAVFGTPHYMSPEQASGAPVDHRGDIYSIGVILYELASARVPFDADNFMGILTQHMYKAPVPLRSLVPPPAEVTPALEAIVLKCLSKRPDDRYQTMAELIADLDAVKSGQAPGALDELKTRSNEFNVPADYFNKAPTPAPLPATPPPFARRRRWPLAVAGMVGVAGLALAVGLLSGNESGETTPPRASAAPQAINVAVGTPAPQPTTQPLLRDVVLAVEPLDAHVFRGGTDLGASPVKIEVPDGQAVELEIRHAGYKSTRLTLDGSESRKVIELEAVQPHSSLARAASRAKTERTTAPSTNKRQSIGGSEIVNPWAP